MMMAPTKMRSHDIDINGNFLLYNFVAVLLVYCHMILNLILSAMKDEELWYSELFSILFIVWNMLTIIHAHVDHFFSSLRHLVIQCIIIIPHLPLNCRLRSCRTNSGL